MADIKEVWIDHIVLTIRETDGVVTLLGQGQTYSADGLPVRVYGPSPLNATPADLSVIDGWMTRVHTAIKTAFDIPDTDLIQESPLPGPIPLVAPDPEPQLRATKAKTGSKK